ncbi:MAG TPA: hypothetical protein VGV86_06325 [Acidimicrobiales bacterium]|nr:hypothetical protein [Acidimicrobiales bacterium]
MESQTASNLTEIDPEPVEDAPVPRPLKVFDHPSNDTLVLAGGCLAAVVLGVWLTSGAWGGGPPAGDDVTAYAIRTDFAIRHLFPRLRVDGWDPSFMLGYQGFLFLGPGSTWAIALTKALTLGMLSTIGAVKVLSIVCFVAVPLTVAFVATSLGLSRRAAGVAAVLALAVNNPYGGGLQALYNVGLIAQQVAVPFFFLALGGMVRLLRDPKPRWTVLTAVSVGVLVVTHTPSLAVLGLVIGIIVGASLIDQRPVEGESTAGGAPSPGVVDRRSLVRVFLAVAAGAALGACFLLPAFAHQDLQGPFIGWGTPPLGERLSQVWRGEFLFQPGVAMLAAVGFAYGALRVLRGLPLAGAVLVTPLVYMVAAHVLQSQWPSSLIMQQLSNRGIGYAGALALLPLAALIAWITGTLDRAGDFLAVGAAAAIVFFTLGPTRDMAREMLVPVPQMQQAAQELARVVPEHARFATQRDFPTEITRTNMIHPDRWLAWASGRNTLNIFHATSSVAAGPPFETDHIVDRPPDAVAQSLSRYGVTHLVTVSDPAAEQIATSPRFTQVWRGSPLAIFALSPNAGQPDPAALLTADGPVSARILEAEPEKLVIEATAGQPVRAQVAVTWSPKWHARVDGRPVRLDRSEQGIMTLALPEGTHRVVLTFGLDMWDRLGILVSLATAGLGGAWLWRHRRSRNAGARSS